ncbi:hypothetical protein P8452_24299 [Trifolium repens]|nr:hypothetical protein P8452_24299 [Trifolium repens]
MPSVKMVAKSHTTCRQDGRYPHVSHTSNKISKRPCSMVAVTDGMEHLDISSQISHNGGFFVNKESSNECANEEHQMSSDIETTARQNGHLFNGCADSIVKTDSFPVSVSASSDPMFFYFDKPDGGHCNLFEADNKEHMTTPPQVDGNNIPSFLTPDMLDYYVNEACFDGFSSDGINLFDDSFSYGNLPDLDFVGTHMIYDFSTLEDTTEAANYQYVGSCEEFQEPMLDSSCFNLICHQAKPPTEELDARSFQFDSERVDYTDPETFIKNLLEVSDKSNLLPALVSKETSKKNDITLVLDLDETLIHSTMAKCDSADFTIQVKLDKEYTVYVRKRPFLHEFLERVSKMFEKIIIFTASKKIYAEKLLDVLDPDKKLFSRRVYRDACIYENGTYTKDLTVLGIDLAKVAIVDNSPQVYKLHVNNGIPIESWFDDPSDSALISLLPFLEKLVDADDVRPVIAEKFGNKKH